MVNIVCIIQARMGSTRLPGKVLKKISGKTILYYVVERIKKSKLIDGIVIATTTNSNDDVIVKEAENLKVDYFRGSEDDVLSRYYFASKKFNADIIIRITSDCPLIDPTIIDTVIIKHIESKADYTANTIERTYPRGFDVEIFNMNILNETYKNATEKYQREHVTLYILENSEKYKLINVKAEGKLNRPDIRVTIDKKEDYKLISKILKHFKNIDFGIEDVIDLLNEKPELLEINKDIKQKDVNKD